MAIEKIIQGDCLEMLKTLPDESVDCCITSPPYYGLRDYGADGQIGLEETPYIYIYKLVNVFREVKRVLKEEGTLWLNIGDSYWGSGSRGYDFTDKWTEASEIQAGSKGTEDLHNLPKLIGNKDGYKNKDLIGIPWMLAFALREDGWYLRQDIIWAKPNPMPESVKDRCTKSHEYLFLLSKSPKYYFNNEAIQEEATTHEQRPDGIVREREYGYESKRNLHPDVYSPRTKNVMSKGQTPNTMHLRREDGLKDVHHIFRNKRDVWTIPVQPTKEAHFATYPEKLVEPCLLAGCPEDGTVLDPFFGSGTTGRVAIKHGRGYIGIELNPEYIEIEKKRLNGVQTALF